MSPPKLEVILAIDTSESMLPAIGAAKAAANEFVAAMPADVPIGVETFADSVSILAPPTTDRDVINTQIESITTGGDTGVVRRGGREPALRSDNAAQGHRAVVGR